MEFVSNFYKDVISKKSFYLPLFFVTIVSYGFSLVNRTVDWDEVIIDHYLGSGKIMLSGRWGMVFWTELFNMLNFNPFLERVMTIVFYIGTALLLCYLFYTICKHRCIFPYTLLACCFISYPLISEFLGYAWTSFIMVGGLFLVLLAMLVLKSQLTQRKKILFAGLLLVIPMSGYESVIFFYITLFCIVLFLESISNKDTKISFKSWFCQVLYYSLPLVIAFVVRMLVTFCILLVFKLHFKSGGSIGVPWLSGDWASIYDNMVVGNFIRYFAKSLVFFPITELVCAIIAFFILLFFRVSKGDSRFSIWLGTMIILSLFSMPILLGSKMPYTPTQNLTLFVSFVFFYIAILMVGKPIIYKTIISVLLSILCWNQIVCLNNLLDLNNLRSENEMAVVKSVGERIVRDYEKKPVIFVTPCSLSPWIKSKAYVKKNSWNGKLYISILNSIFPNSDIEWYCKIPEQNINCCTEQYAALKEIFAYNGFDIDVIGPVEKPHSDSFMKQDLSLLIEATTISEAKKMKPYEIFDNGDYLIVKLGEGPYYLGTQFKIN